MYIYIRIYIYIYIYIYVSKQDHLPGQSISVEGPPMACPEYQRRYKSHKDAVVGFATEVFLMVPEARTNPPPRLWLKSCRSSVKAASEV